MSLNKAIEQGNDILMVYVTRVDGALRLVDVKDVITSTSLETVLAHEALSLDDQPVMLLSRDSIDDPEAFPAALLDTLLDYDASSMGNVLATRCRPLYIAAERTGSGNKSFDALLGIKQALANDTKYASLRAHVRLGTRVTETTLSAMRGKIDLAASASVDLPFVLLDANSGALWQALHYARDDKRLGAILYGDMPLELKVTLCGDAEGFLDRNYGPGIINVRDFVGRTRRLLDLDLTRQAVGSTVSYFSLAGGRDQTAAVGGSGQPVTKSGPADFAGTYLELDAASGQRLSLANTETTSPAGSFALLVVARMHDTALSIGSRQVLVSKRDGQSGWALELRNDGAGTVLRFNAYFDENGTPTVRSTELAAPAANQSVLIHVQVLSVVSDTYLILRAQQVASNVFSGAPALISNGKPITLGADPDAVDGFFDGDIQAVRVVSF